MKKTIISAIIAGIMTISVAGTAFASSVGWQWLDINGDGVSECYYWEYGYILRNTTTPDGYTVNEDGAWIENGAVQTKSEPLEEGYDYNMSRFGGYGTSALVWGENAVDCGDYYSIEYEAYWNYDPDVAVPDETGVARIQKTAVVHWLAYSYEENRMVMKDISLAEYANMYNYTENEWTFSQLRMNGVITDDAGYIIAFYDGNMG